MFKHKDFILKGISTVLDDAILATQNIGDGIETYALYDYIMQSILIKMTGFQEQKLKCIAWDFATNNYEFRVTFLKKFAGAGFSSYDDKSNLLKEIYNKVLEYNSNFDLNKEELLNKSFKDIKNRFDKTNLMKWNEKGYKIFCEKNFITDNDFIIMDRNEIKNLFKTENRKVKLYDSLYKQRNRIAHNTLSYQQNLPTLTGLCENKEDKNYFIWFFILTLIDNIFIDIYKEYLNTYDRILI